jgi:hypothetical protein
VYDVTSRNERVKPGDGVAAMFYVEAEPHYAHCRVVSTNPFVLECSDEPVKLMEPGLRLMLVFEGGKGYSRAVTTVTSLRETAGVWQVFGDKPRWEELDKRVYPRYEVRLPVRVRAATDLEGQTELVDMEAVTANLSLGGALIDGPRKLGAGALVEVTIQLGPQGSRILGIVVRSEDEARFAVQFMDFVGAARHYLHNFLAETA